MTTPLKDGLAVLGTLAFGMPGPWGVITSAALQGLSLMIPDDGTHPIVDAIERCQTEIEDFMINNNIKVDTLLLDSIKSAIDRTKYLDDLYSNPKQMLSNISDMDVLLKVISPLDTPFNQLKVNFTVLDKAKPFLAIAEASMKTYIALRVAVAQCLSLKLSLAQGLAEYYANSGFIAEQEQAYSEQQWVEADYQSLKAYIEEYLCGDDVTAYFKTCIADIRKQRLSQISGLQVEDPYSGMPFNFPTYFYFTDAGVGTDRYGRTDFSDLQAQPGVIYNDAAKHRPDADDARNAHIAQVTAELDTFASETLALPLAAHDILAKAPKVPQPPNQPPEVGLYETHWHGAWREPGKFVRYSFYLLYPAPPGKSTVSPLGPVDPSGISCYLQCDASNSQVPHIKFPDDASKFAVARVLIREVADDANGTNGKQYVVGVPNMMPDYYDLWPVADDQVAPNASSAPVLRWAGYAYKSGDPRRTWPDPYRVRYCYRYVNKVGSSITDSPWSVPFAPAESDIDKQGFVYHPSYYSYQMLVPEQDGCDFVLKRQFEGSDAEVIKHLTKPSAAAGMIFLLDGEGP